MMTASQVRQGRETTARMLEQAGIPVTDKELAATEVTDFGLGNYPQEGAQIVTLLNTKKVGLKIICLLPGQILPEHMHTASLGEEGKEETFRVAHGRLHLFLPGDGKPADLPIPPGKETCYLCRRETLLEPLEQVTLPPDTPHWLMGGEGGCVVYSISSWARCAMDPFTDPGVVRETVVVDG